MAHPIIPSTKNRTSSCFSEMTIHAGNATIVRTITALPAARIILAPQCISSACFNIDRYCPAAMGLAFPTSLFGRVAQEFHLSSASTFALGARCPASAFAAGGARTWRASPQVGQFTVVFTADSGELNVRPHTVHLTSIAMIVFSLK